MKNILIIGNGGREHALAWKVRQSPQAAKVYVAPGNAGTALEVGVENVAIAATDIEALIQFAKTHDIGLTIVGPEAPLAAGIMDRFTAENLRCFGPTKAAARLESSKAFCKDFLQKHHIPTAAYAVFTDLSEARAYLQNSTFPLVIKADGLAAGKGVVIAQNKPEAEQALQDMLGENAVFGTAGNRVVIEAFITGEEASFIVVADGEFALPLATSQDHKARDDGDLGPNTGGMGAYSPAPIVTPELQEQIMQTVIYPTLKGLAAEGHPYTGFLYAGIMLTKANELSPLDNEPLSPLDLELMGRRRHDESPEHIHSYVRTTNRAENNPRSPKTMGIYVLEFNCRLGDPETQPILMRLKSDLVEICLAALDKRLNSIHIEWDPRPALGVVMAAKGYPAHYPQGDEIRGLNTATHKDCKVFHAGTKLAAENIVKTAGGRVLCVTALGENLRDAQTTAYAQAKKIHWGNEYYRSDIGHRAISK